METLQLPYDPSFKPAVDDGCLTVEEAIHRGDRDVYARKLVERFELPEALAYDVADNRRALGQALQQLKDRISERNDARPKARRSATRLFMVGALLIIVSLLAAHGFSKSRAVDHVAAAGLEQLDSKKPNDSRAGRDASTAAADVETTTPTAERVEVDRQLEFDVRRDEQQRVTWVRGPDPASTGQQLATLWSLEFVGVETPAPGDRRAEIRLFDPASGRDLSFAVRQEFGSERWVVGDGDQPIEFR